MGKWSWYSMFRHMLLVNTVWSGYKVQHLLIHYRKLYSCWNSEIVSYSSYWQFTALCRVHKVLRYSLRNLQNIGKVQIILNSLIIISRLKILLLQRSWLHFIPITNLLAKKNHNLISRLAQWYIQGMKLCLTVHTHAHTQKKRTGGTQRTEPKKKC